MRIPVTVHRRARRALLGLALAAMLVVPGAGREAAGDIVFRHAGETPDWPAGTDVIPFEDLDGLIAFRSTLRGVDGRDSTGLMLLDTGCGEMILHRRLARALGLEQDDDAIVDLATPVHPLPRLTAGTLEMRDVDPVVTSREDRLERVAGRAVFGLLAPRRLEDRTLVVDYRRHVWAMIPRRAAMRRPERGDASGVRDLAIDARLSASRAALPELLTAHAVPVPFRLVGDGKIVVSARIADAAPPAYSRPLTWIVDTGSNACVVLDDGLRARTRTSGSWPRLRGLSVATLYGVAGGSATRLPRLELTGGPAPVGLDGVYTMVVGDGSVLADASRAYGEPVHGLLGGTFLARYRIAIDYPNRILWLDADAGATAPPPAPVSPVGLQVRRVEDRLRVVGVADHSPAALQGIAIGDELTAIEGDPVAALDAAAVARRLAGADGTAVNLTMRRDRIERSYHLIRRKLL